MDETKKVKIAQFLSDVVMAEAVREDLIRTFLKPSKDRDVQTLAASRIAIDLLGEAWKELEKNKAKVEKEGEDGVNIGL